MKNGNFFSQLNTTTQKIRENYFQTVLSATGEIETTQKESDWGTLVPRIIGINVLWRVCH
jgi:hypothetical protein